MKKIYLLDTNIVSEFSKENPNPRVVEFYKSWKNLCAISSITWQELTRGVQRLPDSKKKRYLEKCMKEYEETLEIIPYDEFSAQICGELQASAETAGSKLSYYDSQIGAAAISNGMVLVTHNTADFEFMKEKAFLHVEDWFTA